MNTFTGVKITGYTGDNDDLETEKLEFQGSKIKLHIEDSSNKIKLIVDSVEKLFNRISLDEINSRALVIITGNVEIKIKTIKNSSIFQFNSSKVNIEDITDSKIVLMNDSTCNIKNFNAGSSLNQRMNSIAQIENFFNYSQINIWENSKYNIKNKYNGSLISHRNNIEYNNICETLWKEFITVLDKFKTEKIEKAYAIAKASHAGQLRDCGTPYICHPINVAMIIVNELGIKDESTIITALLHDVAEDTNFTLEKIEKEFGSKIANNVKYLTKPANYFNDNEVQKNFYEEIKKAPELVQIVKLSDRLDNLRDLSWVNLGKIKRQIISTKKKYLDWAKEFSPYIHNEMLHLLANYYNKIEYIDD